MERLRGLGADVVVGDIEQPDTLGPALADVAYVITTASTFPADERPDAIDIVERAGTCNLIDASVAAGIRRFVHVSLLESTPGYPHQEAKLASEAYLKASALEYTILKPTSFADVWFSPMLGFDVKAGTVQVFGDGAAPQTWICAADVAAFSVWALDADEAGTPRSSSAGRTGSRSSRSSSCTRSCSGESSSACLSLKRHSRRCTPRAAIRGRSRSPGSC